MTCPSSVPKAARSLLVERFGSVEAFGVLWYCIVASQLAMKSCDLYWHETAEGHDERLGIPYAMDPGNYSLLLEYAPRLRALSPWHLPERRLMQPNPVLRRLGLGDQDRVAVVHADDIGMCQATLPAFAELLDFGLVTSGSVMVPCPWFPAASAFCREHPQADVGVHTTLTCEWDRYRWGPVSTRDEASGLLDAEGYFPRTSQQVQREGTPEAVQAELACQLDRAIAAGIDVTHMDTHMGTVAHQKFMLGYVQLAIERGLPPLMPRLDEAGWRGLGLDLEAASSAARLIQQLEDQGLPLLDYLVGLPLDQPGDHVALAKRILDSLPAGVTHLIIHPAVDTPELRAIAPDWECRVANCRAFMSADLRDYVAAAGIKIIGYRVLRDLMRSG